jgi:ribosome-binding ATPase YchF (GTP1/OBG family)
MSFSVGIVGLPNVGKSTLFKVLTKREVKISPRAFHHDRTKHSASNGTR